MLFSIVEGSSAYAVISGTLTVWLKDKSIVRDGHSRIFVREARRCLENRGASLGPHGVACSRSRPILFAPLGLEPRKAKASTKDERQHAEN
jgi:hypothetical protein